MDTMDHTTGSGTSALPVLTRLSLARLRESGALSASAWETSLDLCGFIPDRRDWFAYWRQIFLLGGALLFVAGVIFFIAWNWAEMHRFVRMALVGSLVAGCGAGALARGLDTRLGQVLLLSCGVLMGPMLAVFGQAYQTGAQLWELFRVWTVLLVLLAAGGKQAGLWFVAWLSGNVFVMLWLGRNMTEPLEALGMFSTLPECVIALAAAVAAWEWAAWKLRGRADYAWLESRWLPRLLFFDLACRITGYLVIALFDGFLWRGLPELFLPHVFVIPLFGILAGGASWFWHRKRTPDLFMLAVILASLAVLAVSLLVKAEFMFYEGVNAIFVWGLIITGITAALGKILLTLQRSLEKNQGGAPHLSRNGPAGSGPAFFGRLRKGISWERLWTQLQALGELTPDAPLPAAETHDSPWYVRAMLAFGGWVAALLFMTFLVLLLFMTFRVRENEGLHLFLIALPVLAVGGVTLTRSGMFLRHFGFALALAGTGCASLGIGVMLDGWWPCFFLIAAFLLAVCLWVNSAVFRFLCALAVSFCIAAGISLAGGFGSNAWDFDERHSVAFWWAAYAPVIWWAALGVGLSLFHLREKEWRGTAKGRVAEPVSHGLLAGMLASQIFALSMRFQVGETYPLLLGSARAVALGGAAGLICLAWMLVKRRNDDAERGFVMFCAAASIPLAWFLPGAALAFYGLAVARLIGNTVMQGVIAAYFFVYMLYYYYFLGVSLLTKSLLLAATGALLLLFAYCLGRYAAGLADEEERHA